jgi:hypothetical protein
MSPWYPAHPLTPTAAATRTSSISVKQTAVKTEPHILVYIFVSRLSYNIFRFRHLFFNFLKTGSCKKEILVGRVLAPFCLSIGTIHDSGSVFRIWNQGWQTFEMQIRNLEKNIPSPQHWIKQIYDFINWTVFVATDKKIPYTGTQWWAHIRLFVTSLPLTLHR